MIETTELHCLPFLLRAKAVWNDLREPHPSLVGAFREIRLDT